MILSDRDIRAAIENGEIEVDPKPSEDQYSPSALDLTLGNIFKVWSKTLRTQGTEVHLNLATQDWPQTSDSFLEDAKLEDDGSIIIAPYDKVPRLLLAKTHEYVAFNMASQIAARVEGRSSYARLGLTVHLTAPTIHCDFDGNITLEIINVGPFYLRLVPFKTRLCQLIFERMTSAPTKALDSYFKGQVSPSGEKAVAPAIKKK